MNIRDLGVVFYSPIGWNTVSSCPQYNVTRSTITGYALYSGGQQNKLLEDKGVVFILTNN